MKYHVHKTLGIGKFLSTRSDHVFVPLNSRRNNIFLAFVIKPEGPKPYLELFYFKVGMFCATFCVLTCIFSILCSIQRQLETLGAQRAGLEDMLKEMKRKVQNMIDDALV